MSRIKLRLPITSMDDVEHNLKLLLNAATNIQGDQIAEGAIGDRQTGQKYLPQNVLGGKITIANGVVSFIEEGEVVAKLDGPGETIQVGTGATKIVIQGGDAPTITIGGETVTVGITNVPAPPEIPPESTTEDLINGFNTQRQSNIDGGYWTIEP